MTTISYTYLPGFMFIVSVDASPTKIFPLGASLIEEVKGIIESNKISENSKRIKAIQEEWKRVGYLPRKISNSLWDDFKPLLNKFYDILKSGALNMDKNEQEIFDNKSKFIDKLKFSKKKLVAFDY